HHADCFAKAGHCASCQSAKAPALFTAVRASSWVVGPLVAAILVGMGGGLLAAGIALSLTPCTRIPIARMLHPQAASLAPARLAGEERPAPLDHRLVPIDLVRHTGWVSATVGRMVVSDGLDEFLEIPLGTSRYTELFLDLESTELAARP